MWAALACAWIEAMTAAVTMAVMPATPIALPTCEAAER